MFDHVTIRVSDLEASRSFYATVFDRQPEGEEFLEWDDFSIAPAEDARPLTRHLHVAFAAPSREHVDAFWRRGVEAGYGSDGEPGLREHYTADYYGGFLLDPDGNSVEAVHRPGRTEAGPPIDHLWLGVGDLDASRRFWETVAEFHSVATAAGYRDNGGPGERPEYHAGYVGAFVLDPDGNNIEAVNHNR